MVLVLRTIGQTQARYYLQGPVVGRWIGSGSPILGLQGSVEARSLMAVLAGRDPGGSPLLPARVDHRAGFDLIMAAPKSLSLLAALGPPHQVNRLQAAHDQAVASVLGYLEGNATWTRRGGANVRIPTEGLIAAAYGHAWSAARDPHLHTHVVLANLVRGDDGRWSCLDSRALYRHAGAAGAIFHASLRHAVAEQGFSFGWKVRADGLSDIVGVPRPAIDAASLRTHQVTEEVQAGLAGRRGRATAAGRTRARPHSSDRDQAWDLRVARAGLDRSRAADLIARAAGAEPKAPAPSAPTPSAPDHALTAGVLSGRSSVFHRQDVVRAVANLATAGASAPVLEKWADDFLASAVSTGDGTWSTAGLQRLEQRISSLATGAGRPPIGLARARDLDAVLGPRTELTPAGQEAVRRLTTGGARVDLVRGDLMSQAWVLDAARVVWAGSGHRVAVIGRSERAGARWQALTGIGPPPALPGHASVLVVDGADRWPTQALHRVLSDADARSAKVVLIDGGTAPPRRRAESPAVEALRSALPAIDCGPTSSRDGLGSPGVGVRVGADGSVALTAGGPAACDLLVAEWHRSSTTGGRPHMVALGPEEAEYLNARARLVRTAAGELAGPAIEVAGRQYQRADLVMALRTTPALGSVPSGTVGAVIAVDDDRRQLTIRWPDRDMVLNPPDLNRAPLTHGYATTPSYLRGNGATPVLALGDPARVAPRLAPDRIFAVMPSPPPDPARPADPLAALLADLGHPPPTGDRPETRLPADAARPLDELWAERDQLAAQLRDTAPPDPRPELRRVAEERDWLLAVPRTGLPPRLAELDGRMAQLTAAADGRNRWLEDHRGPLERYDQLSTAIAWREHALALGAECRPSRAVLAELGPPPRDADPGGPRQAWRQAAGAIEAYRERWALPDKPLRLSPPGVEPGPRRRDEQRVVASCRALHHTRDRDRGLAPSPP